MADPADTKPIGSFDAGIVSTASSPAAIDYLENLSDAKEKIDGWKKRIGHHESSEDMSRKELARQYKEQSEQLGEALQELLKHMADKVYEEVIKDAMSVDGIRGFIKKAYEFLRLIDDQSVREESERKIDNALLQLADSAAHKVVDDPDGAEDGFRKAMAMTEMIAGKKEEELARQKVSYHIAAFVEAIMEKAKDAGNITVGEVKSVVTNAGKFRDMISAADEKERAESAISNYLTKHIDSICSEALARADLTEQDALTVVTDAEELIGLIKVEEASVKSEFTVTKFSAEIIRRFYTGLLEGQAFDDDIRIRFNAAMQMLGHIKDEVATGKGQALLDVAASSKAVEKEDGIKKILNRFKSVKGKFPDLHIFMEHADILIRHSRNIQDLLKEHTAMTDSLQADFDEVKAGNKDLIVFLNNTSEKEYDPSIFDSDAYRKVIKDEDNMEAHTNPKKYAPKLIIARARQRISSASDALENLKKLKGFHGSALQKTLNDEAITSLGKYRKLLGEVLTECNRYVKKLIDAKNTAAVLDLVAVMKHWRNANMKKEDYKKWQALLKAIGKWYRQEADSQDVPLPGTGSANSPPSGLHREEGRAAYKDLSRIAKIVESPASVDDITSNMEYCKALSKEVPAVERYAASKTMPEEVKKQAEDLRVKIDDVAAGEAAAHGQAASKELQADLENDLAEHRLALIDDYAALISDANKQKEVRDQAFTSLDGFDTEIEPTRITKKEIDKMMAQGLRYADETNPKKQAILKTQISTFFAKWFKTGIKVQFKWYKALFISMGGWLPIFIFKFATNKKYREWVIDAAPTFALLVGFSLVGKIPHRSIIKELGHLMGKKPDGDWRHRLLDNVLNNTKLMEKLENWAKQKLKEQAEIKKLPELPEEDIQEDNSPPPPKK